MTSKGKGTQGGSGKTRGVVAPARAAVAAAPVGAGSPANRVRRRHSGTPFRFGTAYMDVKIARHVARDMARLAKDGLTFVVHTFSEYDLQFYRENLRRIVAATHAAGLEAWIDPWGVGKVFGGEPFTGIGAQRIFEIGQVLDDGKPAAMACPNHPEFRAYMRTWVDAVAESGADGVFWDEPHFHSDQFLGGRKGRWGCRCPHCQEKFQRESAGARMPRVETAEVVAFKERSLREFLAECIEYAAQRGLRNTLCVVTHGVPPERVVESWLPLATLPHLEAFGTDPYWIWENQPISTVREYSKALMDVCGKAGRRPQIWIQGFRIPAQREPELSRAIAMTAAAGVRDIAVWAFECCAAESWIASERPDKAWARILADFRATARHHNAPARLRRVAGTSPNSPPRPRKPAKATTT